MIMKKIFLKPVCFFFILFSLLTPSLTAEDADTADVKGGYPADSAQTQGEYHDSTYGEQPPDTIYGPQEEHVYGPRQEEDGRDTDPNGKISDMFPGAGNLMDDAAVQDAPHAAPQEYTPYSPYTPYVPYTPGYQPIYPARPGTEQAPRRPAPAAQTSPASRPAAANSNLRDSPAAPPASASAPGELPHSAEAHEPDEEDPHGNDIDLIPGAGIIDEPLVEVAPDILGFPARLGISLAIVIVQAFLIWLLWRLFKIIARKVIESGQNRIKPITVKKLRLLSTKQIIDVILFLIKILKYLVSGFLLFLTVPIVFSMFPATRHLATTIFSYIFNPVKDIVIGFIMYIPNLFKIIVIIFITRYVIKLLKFFSTQISRGKLVLPGFYSDWAEPTFKILQVLLWAFTVAILYPYLPGSESKVFQGVSVFVGLIFSMGSSTAIGNLVAGLVITYMRPFKIGDRVQIKETTGFVVEKNMMVVRIRTHKNEYVTFPNMLILGSSITNYNTSSDEDAEGLILYAEVTFGYATPWESVHEILINAALSTEYVQKKPKPFVLQTGLDNFYARYQINCYTKEVDKVPKIYALLYENIQNGFHEAGMDMTCANYGVYVQKKDEEDPMQKRKDGEQKN